jgi:hypothetical protein
MSHCGKCGRNLANEHGQIRRLKTGNRDDRKDTLVCNPCAQSVDSSERMSLTIMLALALSGMAWIYFSK